MSKRTFFLLSLLLLLGVKIFLPVITFSSLSGGDYTNISPYRIFYFFNYAFISWQSTFNLGQSVIPFLNYAPYNLLIGLLGQIIPGLVVERIVWWIPYLLISYFSMRTLYVYLFPQTKNAFLASLIYISNSYALTIISGGQISGIGMAYALIPLVIFYYLRFFEQHLNNLRQSISVALLLSLQAVFDIRIVYVTVLGITLLLAVLSVSEKTLTLLAIAKKILYLFILPIFLVILTHSYWILPTVLFRQNPLQDLGAGYTSAQAVQFLSFAKFENALGLLHPNWPENVFGKTSFMRPEFLILPLFAFLSLFFIRKLTKANLFYARYVSMFCLLALLGIFLAKGSTEPFGQVYVFLFEKIPGFILFRDSTKWYPLIAVSFSLLIPFTIGRLSISLQGKKIMGNQKLIAAGIVPVLFLGIYIFSIRFALTNQLGGVLNMQQRNTQDYKQLNSFFASQNGFFRTLWIPSAQRLALGTSIHPIINGQEFFAIYDRQNLYKKLSENTTLETLRNASVKYVIIPEDTHSEIFLEDRSYSETEYKKAVTAISHIPWLHYEKSYGKIRLYRIENYHDHLYLLDPKQAITWKSDSPDKYHIQSKHGTITSNLVFSEAYNPYWIAKIDGKTVSSVKYAGRFNSFSIPTDTKSLDIMYSPQIWVWYGLGVSIFVLIGQIGGLLFLYSKEKNHA